MSSKTPYTCRARQKTRGSIKSRTPHTSHSHRHPRKYYCWQPNRHPLCRRGSSSVHGTQLRTRPISSLDHSSCSLSRTIAQPRITLLPMLSVLDLSHRCHQLPPVVPATYGSFQTPSLTLVISPNPIPSHSASWRLPQTSGSHAISPIAIQQHPFSQSIVLP